LGGRCKTQNNMDNIKLTPIAECGGSKQGSLKITYPEIVAKIFKPNATKLDDSDKVKASWGFEDNKGRKGFVWCYKHYGKKETCTEWSVDGDKDLLTELFGENVSFR
jgi:hypothetical protein